MIITCEARTRMGYIFLQTYINHNPFFDLNKAYLDNNSLNKYVDLQSLEIPILDSFTYETILNQMKISDMIYKDARDRGEFIEDYQNDLDSDGYMKGVELDLTKENFLTLIKDNAFKIFKHKWLDADFIVLTLDKAENIFNLNNIIYPFTKRKDAFVIVHIESKSKYQIGLIRGIISARKDIYPIKYLSKPKFILME
jgi:hypothetical protein